jgi:hypothetical protein
MILYYDIVDKMAHTDIKDCMVPLRKNGPIWWEDLSVFQNGIKNIKQFVQEAPWDFISGAKLFTTVKVCPGFQRHFDNSMLLKFPCDVIIETFEDGSIRWKHSSKDIDITIHDEDQAPGLGNKWIFVKFGWNFTIRTSKESQLFYIDPILFTETPYRSSPGAAVCNKQPLVPSYICFFPKANKRYFFNAGDPMAILQFSDKITTIKKENHEKFVNKQKYGGLKSFFLHTKK